MSDGHPPHTGIARLRTCRLAPIGLLALLVAARAAPPVGAAIALPVLLPVAAEARAPGSGGYSLPRSPFGGRTPSFGMPSAPRTPSFSGGYSLPHVSAPRVPSFGGAAPGDRAFSRERAADALRAWQSPRQMPRTPSTWGSSSGWNSGPPPAAPSWSVRSARGWFPGRGWSPPAYAQQGPARFGIWHGLFLWFLLDRLAQPGFAAFFHNHQDDPGYREWRTQADELAQNDPAVREKLAELDRQLAQSRDQPRDPDYLPPGVPPSAATGGTADRTPTTFATSPSRAGSAMLWIVLLGGGAGLGWLAWQRHRPLQPAGGAPWPASGTGWAASGTNPRSGETMKPLQSLGAMLRHKVSGEPYTPERVRVGMTITCDPTPFVLARNATKVRPPEGGGQNLLINVQAVGRLGEGAAQLIRLYLPDRLSMFQLHFDAAGDPDECRYFSRLDEVTPADAADWAAWLDPAQGMIGWPQFQTKDGKLYDRIWAPGATRIAPYVLNETIESAEGVHTVRSQSMLYGAPTGLAPPAPQLEYILVGAVDAGGQAWVEIAAGIDINAAALALS